jgi:hypothetical protein
MAVTGQHFVGREDELEALVDLLETPERPPRTAVICGEAGIGQDDPLGSRRHIERRRSGTARRRPGRPRPRPATRSALP